jgi:hypothetical protein
MVHLACRTLLLIPDAPTAFMAVTFQELHIYTDGVASILFRSRLSRGQLPASM